jgi:hypothetical protein
MDHPQSVHLEPVQNGASAVAGAVVYDDDLLRYRYGRDAAQNLLYGVLLVEDWNEN